MKRPIIIEIFVWCIIFTAIFCVGIFSYSKIFIEPNIYNIQFKDIDGITKGSPVRFMGINIGHVKKLEPGNGYINVQIIVTQKDMKIPNGTIARVEFYGLGGSKSIELMPADSNGAQGIVSANTLRLHDIAMKAHGIAAIVEAVENMVKGINQSTAEKIFEDLSNTESSKIHKFNSDLEEFETNITEKTDSIKKRQKDVNEKIDNFNAVIEKFNKFIKK